MANTEIQKLKQDIIQSEKIVKKQQKQLSNKIDNGWLDDMDEVLENNPDYFNESFEKINPFPKMEKEEINPKKGLSKLFEKLKKFM